MGVVIVHCSHLKPRVENKAKPRVENKEIKTANVVEGKGRSKLKVMDKKNADAKVPVFAKEINPIKEKLLALLGH